MKPTIGRIVHYVSQDDGAHQAAIISRLRTVETQTEPIVDLAVMDRFGCVIMNGVTHDEDLKASNTWHWPERE